MIAKALNEYRAGEYDEAYETAANAYLGGFEHIEGDLIRKGRRDLVEDLELKFKDLRDGIQAKKALAELESLEDQIKEGLAQALEVLG